MHESRINDANCCVHTDYAPCSVPNNQKTHPHPPTTDHSANCGILSHIGSFRHIAGQHCSIPILLFHPSTVLSMHGLPRQ